MIVLWGSRRGDVQYAGRDYWRSRIPVGALEVPVESTAMFELGRVLEMHSMGPTRKAKRKGQERLVADGAMVRVVGMEPARGVLGVVRCSDWKRLGT